MSSETEESDRDFLLYIELHCDTDLALFSSAHCHRFLRIAGVPDEQHPFMYPKAFYGMKRYNISDLLKTAWENVRAAEFAASGSNCMGAGI